VSADTRLFRFAQVEFPWPLGPPDGRYLLRPEDDPAGSAAHVIVFATLGAPERRRLAGRRRSPREAPPEPPPEPVSTGRATVIDVGDPFAGAETAGAWLGAAGEDELAAGLRVLNRALHAFRLVTADPYLHTVGRGQALTARVGYGAGEEVADGLWTDARELRLSAARSRRARVLQPQARLAAVLSGRESPLACEELALRARQDIDNHRDREAALQLLVALDAAVAELSRDATAGVLRERLTELRAQREPAAAAAQAALGGPLSESQRETVAFTLGRIEAALRARAVQNA
jgi:hypothetical protein